MSFKSYAIIQTPWGYRVFPPEAFMHPDRLHINGNQFLLDSAADEEIFKMFRPGLSWLTKSACKRGFGSGESPLENL